MTPQSNRQTAVLWDSDGGSFLKSLNVGSVLWSESEMSAYSGWCAIQHAVVLAELRWQSNRSSGFYGFEILCKLRMEYRLRCPIAICSFMSEENLRRRFPILDFSQNHPFIRLPVHPDRIIENLEKAEVADEYRLNDIIISYCNPIGKLINLLTHGTYLKQIYRGELNEGQDYSFLSGCSQELNLLKVYLASNPLNDRQLTSAMIFVRNLEQVINDRKIEQAIYAKPLLHGFCDSLRQ